MLPSNASAGRPSAVLGSHLLDCFLEPVGPFLMPASNLSSARSQANQQQQHISGLDELAAFGLISPYTPSDLPPSVAAAFASQPGRVSPAPHDYQGATSPNWPQSPGHSPLISSTRRRGASQGQAHSTGANIAYKRCSADSLTGLLGSAGSVGPLVSGVILSHVEAAMMEDAHGSSEEFDDYGGGEVGTLDDTASSSVSCTRSAPWSPVGHRDRAGSVTSGSLGGMYPRALPPPHRGGSTSQPLGTPPSTSTRNSGSHAVMGPQLPGTAKEGGPTSAPEVPGLGTTQHRSFDSFPVTSARLLVHLQQVEQQMVANTKAFDPSGSHAALGELSESDLFAALEFSSRSGVSARHISRTSCQPPPGPREPGPSSSPAVGHSPSQQLPTSSDGGEAAGIPGPSPSPPPGVTPPPPAPSAAAEPGGGSTAAGGQTHTDEAAMKVLTRLALATNCDREVSGAAVATYLQSPAAQMLRGHSHHRTARRSKSLHQVLEDHRGVLGHSSRHARLAAVTLKATIPERSSASNSSVCSFGAHSLSFRRQTCDGDRSSCAVQDAPLLRTAFSAASASSAGSSTQRGSGAGAAALAVSPGEVVDGDFDLV